MVFTAAPGPVCHVVSRLGMRGFAPHRTVWAMILAKKQTNTTATAGPCTMAAAVLHFRCETPKHGPGWKYGSSGDKMVIVPIESAMGSMLALRYAEYTARGLVSTSRAACTKRSRQARASRRRRTHVPAIEVLARERSSRRRAPVAVARRTVQWRDERSIAFFEVGAGAEQVARDADASRRPKCVDMLLLGSHDFSHTHTRGIVLKL